MPTGYCTVDDVRRALRKADLPGDAAQDRQIVLDAITSQTEWLEKTTKRHWYVSERPSEDTDDLLPTETKSRDDEFDIPTNGGHVHGASELDRRRHSRNSDALLESGPQYERRRRHDRVPKREIRIATGDVNALEPPVDETTPAYTRIRLSRKDVESVSQLLVANADGGYDDWVAESDYTGGTWPDALGEDYYVRVNSGGWSELYLNVHALDDEIATFSNAVYATYAYGHEGVPNSVRRAVAFRAGADLVEDAAFQIPENATVYNVETKAQEMHEQAEELLDPYTEAD